MAAPTFVAAYDSAWTSSTTPQTVTVTTSAGDALVVIGIWGNTGPAFGTPSGNGVTFTSVQDINVTSACEVQAWTGIDSTGGTSWSLSLSNSSGEPWGFIAYRFSGSSGFGNSSGSTGTGAPSLSLTTAAANSAIVFGSGDWNAGAITGLTWLTINSNTPTIGNGEQQQAMQVPTFYTLYSAEWPDAGTAGAKTTGQSAPTGQAWAAVAIEVKGSGGGTTPTMPDSGASSDALLVAAAVPLVGSGAGADRLLAGPRAADSGSAADRMTIGVALKDAGSGADGVTVSSGAVSVTLADSGSAGNAVTVAVSVTLADFGTGADAPVLDADVTLTDAQSAADGVTANQGTTTKTLSDSGAAGDALAVAASIFTADSGAGVDTGADLTGYLPDWGWSRHGRGRTVGRGVPVARRGYRRGHPGCGTASG